MPLLYRILKGVMSVVIITAAVSFWFSDGHADLWKLVGYLSGGLAAYWIITDLFVRPLENQILDLSLKIESLQRQIDRQTKSGKGVTN